MGRTSFNSKFYYRGNNNNGVRGIMLDALSRIKKQITTQIIDFLFFVVAEWCERDYAGCI